ncbi:MAG: hypothetical protein H8D23_30510 [Candidatus Brocadiales bacterium]|nr:hypothetical protein [Candidatus Brocadiales bacterium]
MVDINNMKITKVVSKSQDELTSEKFEDEIYDLAGKSYNEGALAMAKAIRKAFREVAMADGPIPLKFTASQVVGVVQDIMKGA